MDDNISDLLKKGPGFLRQHWGEIYTAYDIIMNFLGKQGADLRLNNTGSVDGIPPEDLKGGIIEIGDEIIIIRAWLQLTPAEQKIVTRILEYEFGDISNKRNALIALWAIRQDNRWRTIVTQLDKKAQKQSSFVETYVTDNKKVSEVEVKGKNLVNNDKVTKEVTGENYTGGEEHTLPFLRSLVKIVRAEAKKTDGDEEQKLQAGYKEAWRHMKALGLPGMPDKETISFLEGSLFKYLEGLQVSIHERAEVIRARQANENVFLRYLRKIVG